MCAAVQVLRPVPIRVGPLYRSLARQEAAAQLQPMDTDPASCSASTIPAGPSAFATSINNGVKEDRRKRILELETRREEVRKRSKLEQMHAQRLAIRHAWLNEVSDYLYRRPKLAFMFVEAAAVAFAGRRDRLIVWAFEQYENYLATHAPLSPQERVEWLLQVALSTTAWRADSKDVSQAFGEYELGPTGEIASLPTTQRQPVRHARFRRQTEPPLLQRVLVHNMLLA